VYGGAPPLGGRKKYPPFLEGTEKVQKAAEKISGFLVYL